MKRILVVLGACLVLALSNICFAGNVLEKNTIKEHENVEMASGKFTHYCTKCGIRVNSPSGHPSASGPCMADRGYHSWART